MLIVLKPRDIWSL